MKKIFIIAAASAVLLGCTPHTQRNDESWEIPPGLKDCQIYRMSNTIGSVLTVIRCPNSSTVAKSDGKSPQTAIFIDGGKE